MSYLPTGQTDNAENEGENEEFSLDGDYTMMTGNIMTETLLMGFMIWV